MFMQRLSKLTLVTMLLLAPALAQANTVDFSTMTFTQNADLLLSSGDLSSGMLGLTGTFSWSGSSPFDVFDVNPSPELDDTGSGFFQLGRFFIRKNKVLLIFIKLNE